jgi:hypothetical protein
MNYAIVKVTDGNYAIDSEGYTSLDSAKVQYHGVCRALWNDTATAKACVMIVDENLDFVTNYKEFISHEVV